MQNNSNISISLLTSSDEPAWQAYVKSHPDATIYHSLEWRDILYNEYRFEPVYMMAKKGVQLAGILPMFIVNNLRGKRLVSLPFSIYGGPLCDNPTVLEELINYVKTESLKRGIKYVKIRSSGSMVGFAQGERYFSFSVELENSTKLLWDDLKGSAKTAVRRAEKSGLLFNVDTGDCALGDFYHLQLISRQRQGLPTPCIQYYRAILNSFEKQSALALVKKDGITVAAGMFLCFKDRAILALSASDLKYQDSRPNDFLIWKSIEWAKQGGLKRLDLGLAQVSAPGLLRFKEKWGRGATPWHDYTYPEEKEAETRGVSYDLGSAIFKRLPLRVAAGLGKYVIRNMG